jgi:Aerotolerance regulator N-terminal
VIVFASPLWLAGLALLPILWWLHRRASRGRTVIVPSVTLFRQAPESAGASHGRRRLDGAFWRRAALIALLSLALAAPSLLHRGARIVVWIDDSLSMQSREPGGSRLELGCRMLAEALKARGAAEVIVRSLSEPGAGRREGAPFGESTACRSRLIGPPHPPPVPLMSRAEEHWLVTDGAHPVINAWAARAPLSRVLQVGTATENAAIVRLAARGNLADPTRFDVDVEVANLGNSIAQRTLTVTRGDRQLSSSPVALEPGARAVLRITTPAGVSAALLARLDPADALAVDDELALELPREPTLALRVDPLCAAPLRLALRANPGLTTAQPGAPADLTISCAALAERGPALLLRRAGTSRPSSRLRWVDDAQFPLQARLDRLRLRVWDSPLAARPGDQVVIAAGDSPLAIRRASPARSLETTLDLEDPQLATEPGYPILIASLVDRAAGRELEGGYVAAREVSESQIAPRERLVAATGARAPRTGLDITPYVLAVALVLMALELTVAAITLLRDLRFYR